MAVGPAPSSNIDAADFEYKCTDYYDPSDEGSIRWDNPDIKISWSVEDPVLSLKDSQAARFKDINFIRPPFAED